MPIDNDDVSRFLELFKSNERSFGSFMPNAKTKMITVKTKYAKEHARSHLEGEVGLGLVAIRDDDTCVWAAIDIDVHGPNSQSVDLLKIEASVTSLNLPLVVCRSKSGGAHCYLFLKEPAPAERVRMSMTRWANQLGFPSAEIFPKQISLKPPNAELPDERPLGNWINLPYFNADSTDRYAVDGGKQVSFEYFLEIAEAKRTLLTAVQVGGNQDYVEGPPCLQGMLENKVEENRNIAAFQAGVFLKRAYPDDWAPRVKEFNQNAFIKPLGKSELNTIISSVRRREYQYKCREEPCKAFCNKDLCRTKQFGISGSDEKANEIPMIENVDKIISTPIRWGITVQGQVVELTTPELFNYEAVRQKVGEKLHLVLPRIKNTEWDNYLREIMTKVNVKHEMTIEDIVFLKLCEYLKRASKDKMRDEDARREDLRRGQPSLVRISRMTFKAGGKVEADEAGDTWYYAFKLSDFIEHLRKRKQLSIPDHQMWTILHRLLGEQAKKDKLRAGAYKVSNVWVVPELWVTEEFIPEKKYETEF
jgi:hypothetical protein